MRSGWAVGLLSLLCAVDICSAASSPTVRFDAVASGHRVEFTDTTQRVLVLADAASYLSWSKQIRGYVEPAEVPQIDFNERVVLVAYLGARGSATSISRATTLRVERGQLVLEIEEPIAGPRCLRLPEEQIPFVAVSIRKRDYLPPVRMHVRKVEISCE